MVSFIHLGHSGRISIQTACSWAWWTKMVLGGGTSATCWPLLWPGEWALWSSWRKTHFLVYVSCSPKVIKHATGLFNETSDELISILRLDNTDNVVGQWDMSEICDFVYRCSLETVFAVVTEQRLGVLRSVPAVGGNISNQTEEDVNTNRQYITLSSQFEKDSFYVSI